MIDITIIPTATFVIMLLAIVISFINATINRLVITRLCGWNEYRVMQKETSEYRSQLMKATRARDQKLLTKLKKKESQINKMQTKIMKPSMVMLPLSMIYILVWYLFLIPTYGATGVAYVPGIAAAPAGIVVVYWYMICSFFFGTLASRILGVTPIS
jgi:uncharacterized membrane protein (DUF106 family)